MLVRDKKEKKMRSSRITASGVLRADHVIMYCACRRRKHRGPRTPERYRDQSEKVEK